MFSKFVMSSPFTPITHNENCPYISNFWADSAEIFLVTLLGMGNNVINPFLDLYQNMVFKIALFRT